MVEQCPNSRQSVTDQSSISRSQLNAKRSLTCERLMGEWSANIPVVKNQLQWLQRSQSKLQTKSVAKRSRCSGKLYGTWSRSRSQTKVKSKIHLVSKTTGWLGWLTSHSGHHHSSANFIKTYPHPVLTQRFTRLFHKL